MPSLTPVETALAIVAVLAAIGLVIYYFRSASQFSGFEEISEDVRQIRKAVSGEVFRDGADLVISGNYGQLPAIIRFSYLENTPGLNIQVKAPATFALSCTPRSAELPGAEGRVPIKINDDVFDARFITRTDFPLQARMFLTGGAAVSRHLKKLCCSAKTFLTINPGAMELSELVIPSSYPGRHVLEHLESMKALARSLREMPGADRVKVQRITREKYAVARVALIVGVIAAISVVVAANRNMLAGAQPPSLDDDTYVPAGMMPVDAPAIPDLEEWRLATEEDFHPDVRGWLRGHRLAPSGRLEGRFSPEGGPRDVAYLLRSEEGAWRLVLLVQGERRYDATWDALDGVAVFSRFNLAGLEWSGPGIAESEVDGLLLIRTAGDPGSALALFPQGERIVTAAPLNYRAIRME